MSLKKYPPAKKRKKNLDTMIKQLSSAKCSCLNFNNFIVNFDIVKLDEIGFVESTNIEENVDFYYGYLDEENIDSDSDFLEWKLAKTLFLYRLCQLHNTSCDDSNQLDLLLWTIQNKLNVLFAKEYKIDWLGNSYEPKWIRYKPVETKTIIDNLQDIEEKTIDPIIQLLKPMQSKNQIIANICLSYKEIEKISIDNLNNLNEVDKSFAKNAWKLAKQLVNNVDGAKGHKGKSELTVQDIAHNYALNISLVHKLLQINEDKKSE